MIGALHSPLILLWWEHFLGKKATIFVNVRYFRLLVLEAQMELDKKSDIWWSVFFFPFFWNNFQNCFVFENFEKVVSPGRSTRYFEILKIVRKLKGKSKRRAKKTFFSPAAGSKWCFLMGFVIKTIDSGEKIAPEGREIFLGTFWRIFFRFLKTKKKTLSMAINYFAKMI